MSTKKLQIIGNLGASVDNTLTQSGQAADAKTTGDAITNLNTLVGDSSVSEQITNALADIDAITNERIDAICGATIYSGEEVEL